MIQNKRQYNVTKGQIALLREVLENSRRSKGEMPPRIFAAMIGGIEGEIRKLRFQLLEYDRLRGARNLHLRSVQEIARVLIQGRIARGLTQEGLAAKVGIRPQQIQRYEDTGYRSASWKRVLEVMGALEIDFRARIPLRPSRKPRQAAPTLPRRAPSPSPPAELTPVHR